VAGERAAGAGGGGHGAILPDRRHMGESYETSEWNRIRTRLKLGENRDPKKFSSPRKDSFSVGKSTEKLVSSKLTQWDTDFLDWRNSL